MTQVSKTSRKTRKRWLAYTCPRHHSPIKYGTQGGWHKFRCGCTGGHA